MSLTAFARYSFRLTAVPHHDNIPSALQPCPITATFLRPYSRAPSMAIFSSALRLRLTAVIDFIHASRRLSIFLCLSARIDFIPPYGDSRLTSIINFSLPLGKNRFSALWRFTPHGENRFFLCLTARIHFIPPYGDSRLTAIINFSLPHGKN